MGLLKKDKDKYIYGNIITDKKYNKHYRKYADGNDIMVQMGPYGWCFEFMIPIAFIAGIYINKQLSGLISFGLALLILLLGAYLLHKVTYHRPFGHIFAIYSLLFEGIVFTYIINMFYNFVTNKDIDMNKLIIIGIVISIIRMKKKFWLAREQYSSSLARM